MGLLIQAAERLSLCFFADGANVVRTEAALAAAREPGEQSFAMAAASGKPDAAGTPSAPPVESREVAPAREALSA